jgi:hypothetical protein
MRLSLIRACAFATVASIALAACAGNNSVPSSPTAMAPPAAPESTEAAPLTSAATTNDEDAAQPAQGDNMSPLAVKTCATSPPQYQWIFDGACDTFTLKSTGGTFTLGEYQSISVKGSIGKNTAKTAAKIVLADATGKGDIGKFQGKSFPLYKGKGTTFVYASAMNQSSQTIKPVVVRNKPVIQYVITDAKGLPGKTCSAAILTHGAGGKVSWDPLPSGYPVKGKTVTISLFTVPSGFELPPVKDQTPLYFAVNCY